MKKSKVVVAAVVMGMPLLGITMYFFRGNGQQAAQHYSIAHEPTSNRSTEHEVPPEAAPSAETAMQLENGMLSLELHDQLLGPILAAISKKSGVNIYSLPSVDSRRISIRLRNVRLDDGLQALLESYDVFFYRSGGSLRSAWVYERDAGMQLVPVPPENWASTADVERQMHDGSPAERIAAIETLVARNGSRSADVVTRALQDENDEVRLRGLDVALSAGVPVPRETLAALTYDGAAPVRALAMEAIANGTALDDARAAEVEQLLQRMLGDPDAEVRAKAAEILDSRRAVH